MAKLESVVLLNSLIYVHTYIYVDAVRKNNVKLRSIINCNIFDNGDTSLLCIDGKVVSFTSFSFKRYVCYRGTYSTVIDTRSRV